MNKDDIQKIKEYTINKVNSRYESLMRDMSKTSLEHEILSEEHNERINIIAEFCDSYEEDEISSVNIDIKSAEVKESLNIMNYHTQFFKLVTGYESFNKFNDDFDTKFQNQEEFNNAKKYLKEAFILFSDISSKTNIYEWDAADYVCNEINSKFGHIIVPAIIKNKINDYIVELKPGTDNDFLVLAKIPKEYSNSDNHSIIVREKMPKAILKIVDETRKINIVNFLKSQNNNSVKYFDNIDTECSLSQILNAKEIYYEVFGKEQFYRFLQNQKKIIPMESMEKSKNDERTV